MNDSAADGSAQSEKLLLKTKLAYGAGELGPAITANISIFFLLVFFTDVAGIPAGLAGNILMIGKILEAINDPFVGFLTDKTKSRLWGRRLPWLLYGATPFGIFFFLQWIVPPFSVWGLFWYYVVIGMVSQVFYSAVHLPYTAMTPELTQDYNERTSLNSFRFTFSIGGSILSLILSKIVFSQMSEFIKYSNLSKSALIFHAMCFEQFGAQRLEALANLAQLRHVSLSDLMETLSIKPVT